MDHAPAFRTEASGRRGLPLPPGGFERTPAAGNWSGTDACFVDMMRGYRCRGGLARELEVLLQLQHRRCGRGTPSIQAKGSIRPEGFERAIRFAWGGWTWLPLFQFVMEDLTLCETPARVVSALGPEFNGWEVAQWFIERNTWLHDRRPIDVMGTELGLVIEAARTDRFVAAG